MGAVRIPSLMVPIHHSMEQFHLQKMAYIKIHPKNPPNLRIKGCSPIASPKLSHTTSNNNRRPKTARAPIAIMWPANRAPQKKMLPQYRLHAKITGLERTGRKEPPCKLLRFSLPPVLTNRRRIFLGSEPPNSGAYAARTPNSSS